MRLIYMYTFDTPGRRNYRGVDKEQKSYAVLSLV